jgi:hypothetical protein
VVEALQGISNWHFLSSMRKLTQSFPSGALALNPWPISSWSAYAPARQAHNLEVASSNLAPATNASLNGKRSPPAQRCKQCSRRNVTRERNSLSVSGTAGYEGFSLTTSTHGLNTGACAL